MTAPQPLSVYLGVVGGVPSIRDVITGPKFVVTCEVVGVGVDDGKLSVLDLERESRGSAMLYDVEQRV